MDTSPLAAEYPLAAAPRASAISSPASISSSSAMESIALATLSQVWALAFTWSASPASCSSQPFIGLKCSISQPAPQAISVPSGSTAAPSTSAPIATVDSPTSSQDPSFRPVAIPSMSSSTPDPASGVVESSLAATNEFPPPENPLDEPDPLNDSPGYPEPASLENPLDEPDPLNDSPGYPEPASPENPLDEPDPLSRTSSRSSGVLIVGLRSGRSRLRLLGRTAP